MLIKGLSLFALIETFLTECARPLNILSIKRLIVFILPSCLFSPPLYCADVPFNLTLSCHSGTWARLESRLNIWRDASCA